MNEIAETDKLATEILFLKQQTAQNIIEIGKRLIEAKDHLGEGEGFVEWLKAKVNFSKSSAYNFIKVAQEFHDVQALGKLGQTKVFALLAIPQEEREQFIQDNDVENMSTRELQKAIREKEELEQKLKESEAQAKKEKAARVKLDKQIKELELQNVDNAKAVDRLKEELKSAKESGNEEEMKQLESKLKEKENALSESREKINHLEKRLKEKPIEVPAVIEKVPESIEKELEDLRQQVSQQADASAIKFRLRFESLVGEFKNLLAVLDEIPNDQQSKYKGAVTGLIEKMQERL